MIDNRPSSQSLLEEHSGDVFKVSLLCWAFQHRTSTSGPDLRQRIEHPEKTS
jgi:hypothetical protein